MQRLLLLLILITPSTFAQIVDTHNVLIRNAKVFNTGSNVDEVTVSVLIRDNVLELVSNEEIPTPEGVIALDAQGGFLLGKLEIGEEPSFLILDTLV